MVVYPNGISCFSLFSLAASKIHQDVSQIIYQNIHPDVLRIIKVQGISKSTGFGPDPLQDPSKNPQAVVATT